MKAKKGGAKGAGGASGNKSANDSPLKDDAADEEEARRLRAEMEAARNSAVCNHMANALAKMAGNKRKLPSKSIGMNSMSTVDTTIPNSSMGISGIDQSGLSQNKTMKLRPITQGAPIREESP